MTRYLYQILLLLLVSVVYTQDVYITEESSVFTVDTNNPDVNILSPNNGDQYFFGQNLNITWEVNDEHPANTVSIYIQENIASSLLIIANNTQNDGIHTVSVPDINSPFAQILIKATDSFGNITWGLSPGYFTIGNPDMDYAVEEQSVDITSTSSSFEIDSTLPEVNVIYPNLQTTFLPSQSLLILWNASDVNLIDNSIDIILVTDLNSEGYFLETNIENTGQKMVTLPPTTTNYGQIVVRASDTFGYNNSDASDEYFNIGFNDDYVYEEESIIIESVSLPVTFDTKAPEFNLINETDYFYPNGGELIQDYSSIPITWNCFDDSFENANVRVGFSYLLGGWESEVVNTSNIFNNESLYDLSIGGIVENSIWGRLVFHATDDYGNVKTKYNNDYFILGSSDGDISAELYDEDNIDMFLGWTWESSKHRVKIAPRALEALQAGDQIVVVGENATQSTDCLSPTGITNLGSAEVFLGVNENNISDHIVVDMGVNHCEYGGGALPGYSQGDSVRIQIIKADTSYFLRPSDYRGSMVFNNTHTIIKEFNTNPYTLGTVNNSYSDLTDGRDWDNFNVYGKVTNHQGSTRSCDGDGVCDTSELLELYTNETNCTANSGTWNGSLCYYDYNGDGEYSPDEVDENIADCYSDCCSQQGTAENEEWCFIEEVNAEEYTHSLVHSNYLPAQTSSATVNYRVWLLDDQGDEIYKTVDTDGFDIQIGTDDIPDYINNLEPGWNWISLNITEDNMSINNIFANSELSNADYIKSQTTASTYYSSGDQWYPDWNMDLLNAYLIDINQETSILYHGTYSNPEDIIISLSTGWNWISYTPNASSSINTALASLSPDNLDYIKGQTVSSTYYSSGNQWYPDITLEPTKGYMIKSSIADNLIYPNIERNLNLSKDPIIAFNSIGFNYRDYEYNASVTIGLDMDHLEISESDKIKIYQNEEIRGIALPEFCPLNEKTLFTLMIYSNQEVENNFSFIYYNAKTNKEYKVREKFDFKRDGITGNIYSPFILTDIALPNRYALENPYPNPFNPTTIINFSVMKDHDNFQLKIFDLRGRLVETIYSGYIKYGFHRYKWDASKYASGIYFVHMVAGENILTKKITLLK